MSRILGWITQTSGRILDPKRDQRIAAAADVVEKRLAKLRDSFQMQAALADLDLFREDAGLIGAEVYRRFLGRAWRDKQLSESEGKQLRWIAGKLELSEQQVQDLNARTAVELLGDVLRRALGDGVLDPSERATLEHLAQYLGQTLPDLARRFFSTDCEGLLRSAFSQIVSQGRFDETAWKRLVHSAGELGLRPHELREAIRVPAERLVEHTLADARLDGRIDPAEEAQIDWLLDNIIADEQVRRYVRAEAGAVKRLQEIADGRLPSVSSRHIGLRAGEIVHCETTATYHRVRMLKSGPKQESFDGTLTITDYRALFSGEAIGLEVNHGRVLSIEPRRGGFELKVTGKGGGVFAVADAVFITTIYEVAVRRANQTIVTPAESTRHIPRDVRQRVWQRDGGRCVECGATDYLEFDHVIPVTKGGSNADQNVQLLCRRCNNTKSDRI